METAKKQLVKSVYTGAWAGDETCMENIDCDYVSVSGDLAFCNEVDLKEFCDAVKEMMEGLA